MKEFIKGKWFPLMIVVVAEAVLLVLLYCNSFRIIYAPNLENNWDAISAVASWVGVVLSFAAIMVAIQIPKKIADRQDKIALFEKKFEVYCELFKILNIGDQLNTLEPHSKFSALHEIEVLYGNNFTSGRDVNEQLTKILTDIYRSDRIIRQSLFLFQFVDKADVNVLTEALINCMVFLIKDTNEMVDMQKDDVKKFIDLCNEFSAKYLRSLELELDLR